MTRIAVVIMLALALVGLYGAPAQADPLTFLPPGPLLFKFFDVETLVTKEGDELRGIFRVTTISDGSGAVKWVELPIATPFSDGTSLTGRFDGLIAARIDDPAGPGATIYFTGGTLTVYSVPFGSYSPTDDALPAPPQICPGGVCPAPWLTADFVPGLVSDDPTTAFDESTTTLIATLVTTLTAGEGSGDGLLEITGGTAGPALKTGGFAGGADAKLHSEITICTPTCVGSGTWPVSSSDPIETARVPQPSVLLLLGAGFLAATLVRRRRIF